MLEIIWTDIEMSLDPDSIDKSKEQDFTGNGVAEIAFREEKTLKRGEDIE